MIIPNMYNIKIICKDENDNATCNIDIDTDITITVTILDFNGEPVIGKNLTIYYDDETSIYTGITNTNGQISTTYTCTEWGIHTFSVETYRTFISINTYTKTEIDTKLNNKSDTNHVHSWRSQACTSYGTLYINETLRLCELRYNRDFSSATADTFYTWHTGAVPSAYRPSIQVNGAINQVGTIYVDSTGAIGGKFANSFNSNRNVKGTVSWYY